MAGAFHYSWPVTGSTLYLRIFQVTDSKVWNGSAFETFVDANVADYDVALTELSTASQEYTVTFPSLSAGLYIVGVYLQGGGTPAITDPVVDSRVCSWDGSKFLRMGDIGSIDGDATAATNLKRSASTIVTGTVNTANTSPTNNLFAADDIVEVTADHFIGRIVIFDDSSGGLYRQATEITDYEWNSTNSEDKFTVTTITEPPTDDETFIIV